MQSFHFDYLVLLLPGLASRTKVLRRGASTLAAGKLVAENPDAACCLGMIYTNTSCYDICRYQLKPRDVQTWERVKNPVIEMAKEVLGVT